MFLLRYLCFVICSLDLDVLRAQRIIGFLCYYPQINGVGKSDHMDNNPVEYCCTRNHCWPFVMFFCTRSRVSQTFAVFN